MKEKLIIKNFGPIKDIDLDLGRVNILIGEQATGKSTVAKVLAVCRYFSNIENDEPTAFTQGLEDWGLKGYIKADSFIFYECRHYSLTVKHAGITQEQWDTVNEEPYEVEETIFYPFLEPLSIEFKNLLSELEKIKIKKNDYLDDPDVIFDPNAKHPQNRIYARAIPPSDFFSNEVRNVLDNPFYLPTERGLQSVFSLGQGSIPNLANFLYKYFEKVDGIQRDFTIETEIEPLNIVYKNQDGIGYIKKKGENEFSLLSNAASGYQSTIPVILVMKHYEKQKRKKTFLIEEPELNLFPIAQYELMKYLVGKSVEGGNNLLIATHSPYILAAINNMMSGFQIGKLDREKTGNILDEKYWLNPDDVSAYYLKTDGKAENIMDNEIMQINGELIDYASEIINREYDKMLEIKYNGHEG